MHHHTRFAPIFRCIFKCLILLVLLLPASGAYAAQFYLSGDLGIADANESGFDVTQTLRVASGFRFNNLGLELGWIKYDDIDYQILPNSFIEIDGVTLHAYWRRKFNDVVGIDLGAGILDWDAKATTLGISAGKDSGTSNFLDIRLITEFNDTAALHVSTRYIPDVSGTDILNVSVGAIVSF